jgi:hypothetical protein
MGSRTNTRKKLFLPIFFGMTIAGAGCTGIWLSVGGVGGGSVGIVVFFI